MNTRSSRPSLLSEIGLAFGLSLVAGAVGSSLALVLPTQVVIRALVAGLTLAYVLYRLCRGQEKTGRIVTLGGACAVSAAAWLLDASMPAYLGIHVAMIWLVRSLYTHRDLREAAIDLGLSALGLAFAIWAAQRSQSLFVATWCFFLLQAMHGAIPAWTQRAYRGGELPQPDETSTDAFANAHRAAEAALQRLAAGR